MSARQAVNQIMTNAVRLAAMHHDQQAEALDNMIHTAWVKLAALKLCKELSILYRYHCNHHFSAL